MNDLSSNGLEGHLRRQNDVMRTEPSSIRHCLTCRHYEPSQSGLGVCHNPDREDARLTTYPAKEVPPETWAYQCCDDWNPKSNLDDGSQTRALATEVMTDRAEQVKAITQSIFEMGVDAFKRREADPTDHGAFLMIPTGPDFGCIHFERHPQVIEDALNSTIR